MAAKSLGELFVVLSARTSGFAQQMSAAGEVVEKLGKKVRGIANDVGGMAFGVAAGAAAVVAAASQFSGPVAAEVDKVKRTFALLSVEIATTLLPAVRSLQQFIATLVSAWRGLSAETRAYVSTGVQVAAVVGASVLAFGKLAGVVAAVAEALSLLSTGAAALAPAKLAAGFTAIRASALSALPAVGSLVVSLLPVIVIAGAIALAAGAFYKAWKENLGGFRDAVKQAWEWLANATQKVIGKVQADFEAFKQSTAAVFEVVVNLAGRFVDGFWQHFEALKDLIKGWVRQQATTLSGIFEFVGVDTQPLLAGLESAMETVDRLSSREALASGLSAGADFAVGVGKGMVAQAAFALDGTAMLFRDIADVAGEGVASIKETLSGIFDGRGMDIPIEVEVKTVGAAPAGGGVSDTLRDVASGKGSKAWQAFTRMSTQTATEATEAVARARESLVGRALGSLGTLGQVISNAAQVAAAGPEAAIASVVMDLMMNSEGFRGVVETLNGVMQSLANALGALFVPLQPVIGALGTVAEALVGALSPALTMIGTMFASLAPPLMVLGAVLQALAPIISLVVQAFLLIHQPFMLLGGPIMRGLFEAMKFTGVAVLTVAKAISSAWNWVLGGVRDFLRGLADLPVVGKLFQAAANGLSSMMVDTAKMGRQIQDLKGLTWSTAMDKATEAAVRFGQATEDATESLTNVPSMWKVALRRGEAQAPQDGPTPPPSSPTAPMPPTSGGWGSAPTGPAAPPPPGEPAGSVVVNINGPGMDRVISEVTVERTRRVAFSSTESPATYTP